MAGTADVDRAAATGSAVPYTRPRSVMQPCHLAQENCRACASRQMTALAPQNETWRTLLLAREASGAHSLDEKSTA